MAAPIATSAIKTNRTNVVGVGLRLKSRIDREVLGLEPDGGGSPRPPRIPSDKFRKSRTRAGPAETLIPDMRTAFRAAASRSFREKNDATKRKNRNCFVTLRLA